jgi:hypothetical protein
MSVNNGLTESQLESNSYENARIKIVNSNESQTTCPYLNKNSCDYLQKARESKCPAFKEGRADEKVKPIKIIML